MIKRLRIERGHSNKEDIKKANKRVKRRPISFTHMEMKS